jgi:phytoene dehydrogenase-like protein
MALKTRYDVVVVGGGHNGLVSAAYLARAGLSVLVLERQDRVGGAAVSERVFAGMDARLSKYAYLLSLLPQRIVDDLGLHFETRRRSTASFTPAIRNGQHQGLLISNVAPEQTEASFRRLTGNREEYRAFQRFYGLVQHFAAQVWPTLLAPLMTRAEMKKRFRSRPEQLAWEMLVEKPLGVGLERLMRDDVVRGIAFTDAKIGVLTHPHDPTLLQNRTFIYHLIGGGTGEWRVPVGGIGALTGELERVARIAGAEIITTALVQRIDPGDMAVTFTGPDGRQTTVAGRFILLNAAPAVMASLLGDEAERSKAEGSVFKINLLLRRLPRLKVNGYTAEAAFTGTFHIGEGYEAMQDSYRLVVQGQMPDLPPGEMYCHSLTDPSILGEGLQGYHTLTLFGLDMPYRLFRAQNDKLRDEALQRYLRHMNVYLAEPIEDCLALDQHGKPCIEAKSPVDLENEVGLPGGHIFHNDMSWPFTDDPQLSGSWGVETQHERIYICGSGAARGGFVSGIPGHNAAMKVLDCERR